MLAWFLAGVLGANLVLVSSASAQTPTSANAAPSQPRHAAPATGAPITPAPSTTFAPLGPLPTAPTNGPLITKPQSGHVNGVFVILSLAGFAVAALLVITQLFLTRRSRRRRGARTL